MYTNVNAVSEDGGVVNPRKQMWAIFPAFLQGFITWLTGNADEAQELKFKRTNLSHLVTAYLTFFLGMAVSFFAYGHNYFFILPAGWILTVSGARKLTTVINHFIVHKDKFFPDSITERFPWLNTVIAEINSSILFVQDFATYREDHIKHHHPDVTATMEDPDMITLWALGFKAGLSKQALWRVFLNNVFNPFSKLHRLFLLARIKTLIFKGNALRYFVTVIVIALLVAVAHYSSFWYIFWMFIFPCTFLYHISALMQFSSEHLWLTDVNSDGILDPAMSLKDKKVRGRNITVERYSGEALPVGKNYSIIKGTILWSKWSFKMLFVHFPLRLFVLPGDLPNHSAHHRGMKDFANAPYALEKMKRSLPSDAVPFREVWGLLNVIDLVFENLSQMEPIFPNKEEIDTDVVLGM